MLGDGVQGCALAEPGGPWRLTFALGRLGNLSSFIQIICGAPQILQFQSTGLPSIFLRAQPWCDFTKLKSNCIQSHNPGISNTVSLIRTPKGQNQLSALQRCPYYRGRESVIFGISGTKQTVHNREVSILQRCP